MTDLNVVNLNPALSLLVHGDSKVGKSWLLDTMPGPRAVFDAEGGSRFTPSRKRVWDPRAEPPPAADGTWDTCLVYVREYDVLRLGLQWLQSGSHPFRSVGMDSVSEVQQRCVDSLVGRNAMQTQDWGTLLREVSATVREFRDLTINAVNPLQAVVMIAMTKMKDGKWRPFVQGALADWLPYYVDVCGYLFTQDDPANPGTILRRMLVTTGQTNFLAGERVGGRLGQVVENPNVSTMLTTIFGPAAGTVPAAATQEG